MFIADVCPKPHCIRDFAFWWQHEDCSYQSFFLGPYNNNSLGLLAPSIKVPGSPPPTSQSVSAMLAPLVPTQLIFVVWYNGTMLPQAQTRVTASAEFLPIPSFMETFSNFTYGNPLTPLLM